MLHLLTTQTADSFGEKNIIKLLLELPDTVTHKHSIRSLSISHCHLQCYGHKDKTVSKAFIHLSLQKHTSQRNPSD